MSANITFSMLEDTPKDLTVSKGFFAAFEGSTQGKIITVEQGAGALNLSPGTKVILKDLSHDSVSFENYETHVLIKDSEGNIIVEAYVDNNAETEVQFSDKAISLNT